MRVLKTGPVPLAATRSASLFICSQFIVVGSQTSLSTLASRRSVNDYISMAPLPWSACFFVLLYHTTCQSAGANASLDLREPPLLTPPASGENSTLSSHNTTTSTFSVTATSVNVQSGKPLDTSSTSTQGPDAIVQSSASVTTSNALQPTGAFPTSNSGSFTTQPIVTADSLSSAISCASVLTVWGSSSARWSLNQGGVTHSLSTRSIPLQVYTVPAYSAAQTTKVCDGHARVVGSTRARIGNQTISHDASISIFNRTISRSYPSPRPSCSIDMDDCVALASLNPALVAPKNGTVICSTWTSPSGYAAGPTPTAIGFGQGGTSTCQQCTIVVSTARLLYWPVQATSGSGNICNNNVTFDPSTIISGTPTGHGPNTFVTKGITITSPSVAISLTGISRLDNCYTELSESIIPVHPSDVTSLRGVGPATYHYLPFNFADLNYHCQAPNGSLYVAGVPGASCYPAVPASAYFHASSVWNWYSDRE